MPFRLETLLAHASVQLVKSEGVGGTTFSAATSGKLQIWRPGRLVRSVAAQLSRRVELPPDIGGHPGRPAYIKTPVPVELHIYDPKGNEFTADQVTLADLAKFRDRRGVPSGVWGYAVRAQILVDLEPGERLLARGDLQLVIQLAETIGSESAAPLSRPGA